MDTDLFAVMQNTTIDPFEARITAVGYTIATIMGAFGLAAAIIVYGGKLRRYWSNRNRSLQ